MTGIFITGMHRSGTSALARLLGQMGAYIGEQDQLLAADSGNPEGYFERLDVLDCNRRLLRQSNCSWYQVQHWQLPDFSAIPPGISGEMRRVVEQLAAKPLWLIKDPRFCLTLPCWLPLAQNPSLIILSRDPRDIAVSLTQRNAMPEAYGLALWEFYAVALIHNTLSLPKIFVRHLDLLHEPMRVASALQHAIPSLQMPGEQPQAVKQSVTTSTLRLTPYQEKLAAMLAGDVPFEPELEVSGRSFDIMEKLGITISASAV